MLQGMHDCSQKTGSGSYFAGSCRRDPDRRYLLHDQAALLLKLTLHLVVQHGPWNRLPHLPER